MHFVLYMPRALVPHHAKPAHTSGAVSASWVVPSLDPKLTAERSGSLATVFGDCDRQAMHTEDMEES